MAVAVMVIGHSSVYFGERLDVASARVSPADVSEVDLGNFVISWIVSSCAPVFILLAGLGAYLRLLGSGSKREVARFLAIRGLLLVAIDLFVVPILKWFYFDPRQLEVGALWAIGWGMVALAGLLFFRVGVVAIVGLVIVLAHNSLDGVQVVDGGFLKGIGVLLLQSGVLNIGSWMSITLHWPLLPWIGVMACGFALGELYRLPPSMRRTMLFGTGMNLLVMFLFLRGFDFYGDPTPWQSQESFWRSVMSFLNCTKQPPSLCFLLMTLGPALAWLGWVEDRRSVRLERFAALGCVPLFCYLGHWLLLHVLAIAVAMGRGLPTGWLFSMPSGETGRGVGWQADFGLSTPLVLLLGAATIVFLYVSARRFAQIKFLRRPRWASYL